MAHGEMQGVVFPSRQGTEQAFEEQSVSMSLKRAGYDITPLDIQRAHRVWVAVEGGGDLVAWEKFLLGPTR